MPITDWDDAYANAAYIPGAETFLSDWPERSQRLREAHAPERLIYGSGARQTIDLYRPKTASQGLTVIVHGGYWMRFSPAEFGFLAAGPLAHGQSVAVVSYTLAPDARIAAITAEVARAVTMAAAAVPGPIRLTGHSAGGHLVTRMGCAGVLQAEVAARIAHIVSVSGVHDLRPLLRTQMNATLRLDSAEALAESPALQRPLEALRLTCAVGSEERPRIHQAKRSPGQYLVGAWGRDASHAACGQAPLRRHRCAGRPRRGADPRLAG